MSQEKKSVNDVVNMIFNFTHAYPDVDKTVEFIRKHGYELSVSGKDSGSMNARSLDALLDPRLLNHGGYADFRKIRDALVQVEVDRFRDKPANLFRSASLFKLAAEQEMRWALEKNPEIALEYAKDPINFIANFKLDPGLKAIFKDFLKITEDHARENDLPFNPALTVHTLVFSCINGPILKHFDEQSRNEKLSEKQREQAKAAYESLGRGPARTLTDCNTVISGAFHGKFESLTDTRYRDHVVSQKDVEKYLNVLDSKLVEIDPNRGVGAVLSNATVTKNVQQFGEMRDKWRFENRTALEKMRDSFVGFFKDGWKSIKSAFKKTEEPTIASKQEAEPEMNTNPLHQENPSSKSSDQPPVTDRGPEFDPEIYAEPEPEDMITPKGNINPSVDLPPPSGPSDAPEEIQQNGALPMDLETSSGAQMGEPETEPAPMEKEGEQDKVDLRDYSDEGLPSPDQIQQLHQEPKPTTPEGPSSTGSQALPEPKTPQGPKNG